MISLISMAYLESTGSRSGSPPAAWLSPRPD